MINYAYYNYNRTLTRLVYTTCISKPENVRDKKYPNKLKTIIETDDEIARNSFGTVATRIPAHAGKIDPPKKRRNHKHIPNPIKDLINIDSIANKAAVVPINILLISRFN
jgi:hypothetical protein